MPRRPGRARAPSRQASTCARTATPHTVQAGAFSFPLRLAAACACTATPQRTPAAASSLSRQASACAYHVGRGVLELRDAKPPLAHARRAAHRAGPGVFIVAPGLSLRTRRHAVYCQAGLGVLDRRRANLRLRVHRYAAPYAGRGVLLVAPSFRMRLLRHAACRPADRVALAPRQASVCARTTHRLPPCKPGRTPCRVKPLPAQARYAAYHASPGRPPCRGGCPPAHAPPCRIPRRSGASSIAVAPGRRLRMPCHAAHHAGRDALTRRRARRPPAYAPARRSPSWSGAASIPGAPVLHLRVHATPHPMSARGLTRRSPGFRLRMHRHAGYHAGRGRPQSPARQSSTCACMPRSIPRRPGALLAARQASACAGAAPWQTITPGRHHLPACQVPPAHVRHAVEHSADGGALMPCRARPPPARAPSRRIPCRSWRCRSPARQASVCSSTAAPHSAPAGASSFFGAPSGRLLLHVPPPTMPAGASFLVGAPGLPHAHVPHAADHAGRGVLRAATPSLRLRMRCHAAYPQPGASSLTCMPGLRLPMHRHAAYRHAGRGALMPCHARRPPAHAPRRRKPCKPERSRSPARQASACACSSRCIPPCKPGRPLSPSRPAFPCACAPFRIARRILSARGAIT